MMNYVLSPSILAADFKDLGQEMKKTEEKYLMTSYQSVQRKYFQNCT